MNDCDSATNVSRVIVVLCYRRTEHLKKVLEGLEQAFLVETFTFVFVVQDPIDSVLNIINSSKLQNKIVLEIEGSNYLSAAQAINGNLATGLKYAFLTLGSSLTIVLEDDIVISKDALCFFIQAFKSNISKRGFRGVNAFSESTDSSPNQNSVIRLKYGLGWGWAIPRKTYFRLMRYWTGYENDHWDFIFEPYFRTGFVVNPRRSRIINIGFDESATHTSMNSSLNNKIEKSFIKHDTDHSCELLLDNHSFPWMGKELNIRQKSLFMQLIISLAAKLLFRIYVLDVGNREVYHRVRRIFSIFYS